MAHAYVRYGRCARVWISVVPGFVLFEPADVQAVLASPLHTDKMFAYRFLRSFLGDGLLTSNGDQWQRHRRLIQPAFHRRHLAEFVTVFGRASAAAVGRLSGRLASTDDGDRDVDVTGMANEFVLDVLHGIFHRALFQVGH